MRKKSVLSIAVVLIVIMALLSGCAGQSGVVSETQSEAQAPVQETRSPAQETPEASDAQAPDSEEAAAQQPDETAPEPQGLITLATTTSTDDSGLLDFILPVFTAETGWEIQVISVGTGAALQLGRDGEADVLLVHARAEEDRFVDEGYAERRYDVMYNDFVVVGPADGEISHNSDIEATFGQILEQELPFVSRGDNSGTHMRELQIWQRLGLVPEDNSQYIEVGQGMGATLGMTVEMNAYTLSDRATWLAYPNVGNLIIVCEGSELLLNPYGIMAVSSSLEPDGAQAFIDWMISPSAQELIGAFGVEQFGQPLFFPDA